MKRDRLEAGLSLGALVILALVCAWAAVSGKPLLGLALLFIGCMIVVSRGGIE